MSTKGRSRSKKGNSTTPPPPVAEGASPSAPPEALEAAPSDTITSTPPPASVEQTETSSIPPVALVGADGVERPSKPARKRAPRSRPPAGLAEAATTPKPPESKAPRARKSKTPAPSAVSRKGAQLGLTPQPLPTIDQTPSHADGVPPVAERNSASVRMAPGGWRAPGAVDPDDQSVPPVVDDGEAVAAHPPELDHDFFSQHPPPSHRVAELIDDDPRDPKVVQKMSAAVQQRRARLAKYVKWAVGLSAAVCLVALVRQRMAPGDAAAARGATPTAAQVLAKPAPAINVEPKAADIAAEAPTPGEATPPLADTAATADPAKPDQAMPEVAKAETEEKLDPKKDEPKKDEAQKPEETASGEIDVEGSKKARTEATNLMESYQLPKAIEAGERAVALNPTDGQAWYVLGSAYLMKNDRDNAKRCFSRCLMEKGGNKAECAMFGGRRN